MAFIIAWSLYAALLPVTLARAHSPGVRTIEVLAEYRHRVTAPADGETTVPTENTFAGGAAPTGPVVSPAILYTNLFGRNARFALNEKSQLTDLILGISEDRQLYVVITPGIAALNRNKDPLGFLSASVDSNLPLLPAQWSVIGPAYTFEPPGATFTPPMTFSWGYGSYGIPNGATERDLALAYFDSETRTWTELPGSLDVRTRSITAPVGHLTSFAMIARISSPVEPASPIPPPAPVSMPAPTPPAASAPSIPIPPRPTQPVITPSSAAPSVTLLPSVSTTTFTAAPAQPPISVSPSFPVTPSAPAVPAYMSLVWVVIGGIVLILAIVAFQGRLKRK